VEEELAGLEEATELEEAMGLEVGFEVELPPIVALGEVAGLTGVLPGVEVGEITSEVEEEPATEELCCALLEGLDTKVEVAKVEGVAVLVGEMVSIEETMPLVPEETGEDEGERVTAIEVEEEVVNE
jgi:hypothetical protein